MNVIRGGQQTNLLLNAIEAARAGADADSPWSPTRSAAWRSVRRVHRGNELVAALQNGTQQVASIMPPAAT